MSPRSRGRKARAGRTTARPSPPARTAAELVAHALSVESAPPNAGSRPTSAREPAGSAQLSITALNCGVLREVPPHGLGMTYAFDTSGWRRAGRVSIRFDGRLLEPSAEAEQTARTFTVTDEVDVPAHAGRVTVTARAPKVTPGRWQITAAGSVEILADIDATARTWRLPAATAVGSTSFEPVMRVRAPGARLGIWPALVLIGALLAFASQLLIAPRLHLPGWRLVAVSVVASLLGLVASKVYHLVLHPKESGGLATSGMGVQGFVLGAVGTVVGGSAIAGMPVLRVLDAIAPGLLLGMTIGRFGCFFGGCCAGRPTSGRGLWSSDRHVGIRRIPVQLFESGIAFSLGLGSYVAAVNRVAPPGVVFVGAIAAYTLGRQLLFPLRDIARQTRYGRKLMITLTAGLLLIDIAVGATR